MSRTVTIEIRVSDPDSYKTLGKTEFSASEELFDADVAAAAVTKAARSMLIRAVTAAVDPSPIDDSVDDEARFETEAVRS